MQKTDTQKPKNLVFIALLLLAVSSLGVAAFACYTFNSDNEKLSGQLNYIEHIVGDVQHQNEKQNLFSDDLAKVVLTMCRDIKFKKTEPCIRLVRIVEYNDKLEKGIVGIKLD